jgi:hypothetical protein
MVIKQPPPNLPRRGRGFKIFFNSEKTPPFGAMSLN